MEYGETKAAKDAAAKNAAAAREETGRDSFVEYYIEKLENADTREYIRHRILEEMRYYSRESGTHKRQYYLFSTAAIVLGALIPVASIFSDSTVLMKVLISALGSAVTAINAYLALHNSRDIWMMCRETREELLQILLYYFNRADIFADEALTSQEKDRLLIETCESILKKEHRDRFDLQDTLRRYTNPAGGEAV